MVYMGPSDSYTVSHQATSITSFDNATGFLEQAVFCPCGEYHRGPYAWKTVIQHQCKHQDSPLLIDNLVPSLAICVTCGASFNVDYEVLSEQGSGC